jgi:hypothetical protein
MARFKLNQGDVFTIPLNEREVGYGQIVCFPMTKDSFIMAVFDYKTDVLNEYDIKEICNSPILFLGYSLDALLYHKEWVILGNYTKNLDTIIMPYHRLGTPPDDIWLTDYKSRRVKEITEKEFNLLDYQTTVSPIRYENALKAHCGYGEWINEDYDKLLYSSTIESARIAKEILG